MLRETASGKMAASSQRNPSSHLQRRDLPGRPPQDGNGCWSGPGHGAGGRRPCTLPDLRRGRREAARAPDPGLEPLSPDPRGAPPCAPTSPSGTPRALVASDPGRGAPPWVGGALRPGDRAGKNPSLDALFIDLIGAVLRVKEKEPE